ncbi:MAG: AsmA-like C-terminal region-containing protein, partial [Desulfuromonadaceae bacterium]|nr:AsmA-like C-terminal region-containing protein [Desulfuromonadaceae bacterium]
MVERGMPFSSMEGSFVLRDGVLTTEDLQVTSNAMILSLVGAVDLVKEELTFLLGVQPFGTVDQVITRIPIAGWLLTGEDKALITAHFAITGPSKAPKVQAIPVTSVSSKVLGIFKRVLGLPGKLVTDPVEVITGQPAEPPP